MTDIRISAAGQNVSSLAIVSADQETILGDGTAENPLRAVASGGVGTFTASFTGSRDPIPGNALRCVADGVGFAIANGAIEQAAVVALAEEFLGESTVRCRSRGLLELTTDQWDQVTGQTGGLTVGAVYYLSNNNLDHSGEISTDLGDFISQVGVAVNATTMLVGLPAVPVENV